MTDNTTAASAAEAVTQAQAELENATAAHGEAQEASNSARAVVAELEAAADRGEDVDIDAYTRARAEMGIRARRTAALAGAVSAAQQAVDAAVKAEGEAKLREMIAAIPSPERARQKVEKAFAEYLTAVRAEDDATREVYRVANSLPDIPHGRHEPDASGWPSFATFFADGRVEMKGRLGHLLIDGRRVARPDVRALGERLAEGLAQQARAPR